MDGKYYTYAADLVRIVLNNTENVSRGDATELLTTIANIINMDPIELKEKLGKYYEANQEKFTQQAVVNVMRRLGI